MTLEGKKTKMTVISTLSHEANKATNGSTSGSNDTADKGRARFMKVRLEMEQGEKKLHCTKIYGRETPSEEEKVKMREMCKGRENRLYRVIRKQSTK